MTSTRTTHEMNIEPRYVVVIRSALILSVALAASRADASQLIAPYEGDSNVETTVEALPVAPSQGQNISDLLEAITKTIVDVGWSGTLRVEVSRRLVIAEGRDDDR